MNVCRACVSSSSGDLVPIFSKLGDQFIANVIVDCSSVTIVEDDGLPSFVCKECLTSVQMIADFATKVRESDRKLRQLFKSEVTLKAIEEPNTEEGESDVLSTALDQVKVEYDDDVEKVEKSVSESEGESESDALDFEDGNDSDWNDAEQKQSEDELEIATAKRKTKQKAVVEQDSDEDEEEASSSKRPKRRSAKKKVVKDDDDEDEDDDMAEDTMTEMEQEMFELVKIDPARHICCWCCKDFETRDELKAHGVEHNDRRRRQTYKPHSCEICYRRFIRVKSFENHMIMAAGLSAKEIHQCKRCSARFLAPKRRRMHALCHHKEDEKLAQLELKRKKKTPTCCNRFCYQEFTTEEELLEHGLKEHISNKRAEVDPKQPHECPVCYKNFESKKSLHRHRNRIYRAGMQCSICGKEFKSRPAMMTHERKHVDERPYGCEICGKWFTTTHGLKNHLAVHKDERPFACSVCGWSFKRECNLKMHMLIHSDTLPFKCEVCGKSFKGKYHLQYHMRIHTGHKPWQCRYCEKSFADHANRARHETSHTGIKPYKCTYCDKSFIRKRYQIEHESTHTGIKPYRCEMCNRTFGQKAALKKHLDMHPLAPENQLSLAQPSPMAEMPMSPQMPPPPAPTTVAQGMTLQQAAVMMAGSGAGYSQQPM